MEGNEEAWRKGPKEEKGRVVELSERPSLCLSVKDGEAVVGSSDHALYTVNVETGKIGRRLYGGAHGHREWVTCVDHLSDGRILSGGMDGRLCLWERVGVRSTSLVGGHLASISGVKVGHGHAHAVTSSYDKTLLIWNLSSPRPKPMCRLEGHSGAVMEFCISKRCIASGCRDGGVILWDRETGMVVQTFRKAHQGHVTAIECFVHDNDDDNGNEINHNIFLSGGQDGILQVWDSRIKSSIHTTSLHRSPKGKGAISCLAISHMKTNNSFILSAGADKTMKLLDPRSSFRVIHTMNGHKDFIYSIFTSSNLSWSGGGDGSLLLHDLGTGNCLYGLGASSNGSAIRCIGSDPYVTRIICTGDDGNVMIYSI